MEPGPCQYVSIDDNGLHLIIVDGITGYTLNTSSLAFAEISDLNFPSGTESIAHLNQRIIAVSPLSREFRISQILDAPNWTDPLGGAYVYATKENYSDMLIAVKALNGVLLLFGTDSIEFWQDTGATPVPFQRINGATSTYGLKAIQSFSFLGNTCVFLAKSPDGGVKVVKINGYEIVPISDSDIEYIFSNFSNTEDAVSLVYSAYGHPIYQLTFPSENRTFAYDFKTEIWHEAQTGLDVVGRHSGNLGISFNGRNYISCVNSSGEIFELDEDAYTDDGEVIPREVCTRHIRVDGNELFLAQLFLDFETGVAGAPNVMISVSRDGGRTFGEEKIRSLGAVGKYLARVVVNRLGRARDFVVKIRMTDPSKFVLTSGSVVMEAADG